MIGIDIGKLTDHITEAVTKHMQPFHDELGRVNENLVELTGLLTEIRDLLNYQEPL